METKHLSAEILGDIRGVIFDLDGTITDSEVVYKKNWAECAPMFGAVNNPKFVNLVSGSSKEACIELIRQYYPNVVCPAAYRMYVMDKTTFEMGKHVPLKPGAEECIKALYEMGYKLAIGSSNYKNHIVKCLKSAGLLDYFKVIASDEDVTNGKPDPEIFITAAQKIGLKPEQCIVVEDSLNGVLASCNSKCKTVLVPDTYMPTDDILQKADGVYSSLFNFLADITKPANR